MIVTIKHDIVDLETYLALRSQTNWTKPDSIHAARALKNSLSGITANIDNRIIGMARIVGDGALNLYIQDVIIDENYRGQGNGKILMTALIAQLKTTYPKQITIGLMAATAQEAFYEKFGFQARRHETYGAGMTAQLDTLEC